MADPQNVWKGSKLILALTVLVFVLLAIAIVGSCQESNTPEEILNPPDPIPEAGAAAFAAGVPETAPLRAA